MDILRRHVANRYRVLTSDPEALLHVLQGHSEFQDATVLGPNVITLSAQGESSTVRSEIESIASGHHIEVYDVSRSTSIEDVFRMVTRHEN